MRHLSVLEKKAVRGPEMLDFELCFKIFLFLFKYVLFKEVLFLFKYGKASR